jgi:hypothetical protein
MQSFWFRAMLALLMAGGASSAAYADAALLLGEPYGKFGTFSPTGHAAVYLSRVCTVTPTVLRRCEPGELGSVISRYHRVAGRDWVAIPLIPYLYAVERASAAPAEANAATVAVLRDAYRRRHLRDLVPDGPDGTMPRGDWIQLVGAAYDRSIVAFSIVTSEEQDEELIRLLNERDNEVRFNLLFRNCADFARDIVNFYHPNAIRSSVLADLGITTPKQIAKALVGFSARRPALRLTGIIVAQIPGSRPLSGRARGVLEGLVKSKKYVIPLALVQPLVPTGLAVGYVAGGRFNPHKHVRETHDPETVERHGLATVRSN